MKGKITVALAMIVAALALATPMRTGDSGQVPAVNRSCYECHNQKVVKQKAPVHKRAVAKLSEIEQRVANYIKSVNPGANAPLLAKAIVKNAPKAQMEPELFLAILAHESGNFRPKLKVCYDRKIKGSIITMCDHGLAQLNDYYQAGKWDFERAQVDDVYAIECSAKIFGGLHKLYSEEMPTDWWAAYNTVVEKPRKVYEALVMAKFSQVLAVTRRS